MAKPPQNFGESHETTALIAGIAAFATWGLIPGYWKLLKGLPPPEILAHRFVWTSLFLIVVLTWQGRWPEVKQVLASRRATLYCLASGAAIACNWFFFIFAVLINRVLETSLGYFMTPLVNVLFGAIFLRERLTPVQMLSLLLAIAGVIYLTVDYGRLPWIAIVLCTSFGLYGLLRKKSGTSAIPGLFLETVSLVPIAFVYLVLLKSPNRIFSVENWQTSGLLISTGIVTAVPLFWFGYAARHLRLTTVGFLQYLAPTGSFFLGVFAYHEPFTRAHLITFSLIWIALVIFTTEALLRWRSSRVREIATSALGPSPLD